MKRATSGLATALATFRQAVEISFIRVGKGSDAAIKRSRCTCVRLSATYTSIRVASLEHRVYKDCNDRWTTRGSASCGRHSRRFLLASEKIAAVAMLSGASRSCTRTFNFRLDRPGERAAVRWEEVTNTRAKHGRAEHDRGTDCLICENNEKLEGERLERLLLGD